MEFLNGLKTFLSVIWKGISEKGKFTTILGLTIIISAVVDPLIKHNQGIVLGESYMFQTIYFIIAGIILIILPSEIKISKSGLEIKD